MEEGIADSIIIKVGQGIMRISRNLDKTGYPEIYRVKEDKRKDSVNEKDKDTLSAAGISE